MSEQQTTSACPHPEAVGTRWGDPISEERQAELQGDLDLWVWEWKNQRNHHGRRGPFDKRPDQIGTGKQLTGADMFWLAERAGRSSALGGWATHLQLQGVYLFGAHLLNSAGRTKAW